MEPTGKEAIDIQNKEEKKDEKEPTEEEKEGTSSLL
jgi:hypothetical protein